MRGIAVIAEIAVIARDREKEAGRSGVIELDTKKSNPAQCNLFSSYHQASTSLGRADRRMNRMARWRCQRPRPKTCRRQSGKAAAPTSCSRTSGTWAFAIPAQWPRNGVYSRGKGIQKSA